jgi:RNA polymerase sigma factor (sigma-70 family)
VNVKDFLPRIRQLAYKYSFGDHWLYEDLVQVGCIGFLKARDTYEPAHGTPFSAWMWRYVTGEMLHYLRKFPVNEYDFFDTDYEKLIPDEKNCFASYYENKDFIDYLFSKISRREASILRCIYLDELNQEETAKVLRIIPMTV